MPNVVDFRPVPNQPPKPRRVARLVIEIDEDTGERSSRLFGVKPAHVPDLCLEMYSRLAQFEPYLTEQAELPETIQQQPRTTIL